MSEKNWGEIGVAFVIGAAVGAALGILFAPKSGKETRAIIKEKAQEVGEKASEIIESAKEKVAEVGCKAKQQLAQ